MSVPPLEQLDYANRPARPGALTAIAIIGIIFGSFGLLCLGAASITTVLGVGRQTAQQPPELLAFNLISIVLGFILSIVLLIGSIGALGLRTWARTMLIAFAIVDLIFDVVKFIAGMAWAIPKTLKLMEANPAPNLTAEQVRQMQQAMPIIRATSMIAPIAAFLITVAFSLALLLILRRADVKAAFSGSDPLAPLPPAA